MVTIRKEQTDTNANGVLDLSSAEVSQLANIDAVTLSNAQWGYLGAMNQAVANTDSVQFANVTAGAGGALRTNTADTNTLLLQAYDVDGTSYITFATLTAGNTPTMALSGDVTGVTQSPLNNSTKLATTAYVDAAVSVENIFDRTGATITVANAGDKLDFGSAGVVIESVASLLSVVAATGITPVNDVNIPIESSTAGDTTVTANPAIAAGTNGQRLRLIGTNNTKTVTFNNGNGLSLDNGQSFTLGQNDVLEFVFYNSTWIETSRKDNS